MYTELESPHHPGFTVRQQYTDAPDAATAAAAAGQYGLVVAANALGSAAVLAGSWRPQPEPLPPTVICSDTVIGRLLATGAGGLAWRRLRQSAAAASLHDAYRGQTLQAAVREHQLREVLTHFDRAGIKPLLSKGWAVARLYPEPALRPGEREASRAEKLVVVLQGKKTYRMELPEARWNALQPGQSVSAVIRGGWSVLELHP